MKSFKYIITDTHGIHARPAGLIAKIAKEYDDTAVSVTKGDTTIKANRLMKLMSLAIKQGDDVTVTVEGEHEDEVFEKVKDFFEKNL